MYNLDRLMIQNDPLTLRQSVRNFSKTAMVYNFLTNPSAMFVSLAAIASMAIYLAGGAPSDYVRKHFWTQVFKHLIFSVTYAQVFFEAAFIRSAQFGRIWRLGITCIPLCVYCGLSLGVAVWVKYQYGRTDCICIVRSSTHYRSSGTLFRQTGRNDYMAGPSGKSFQCQEMQFFDEAIVISETNPIVTSEAVAKMNSLK